MANPVTHFQIIAKDPDGVASFYGRLFGWKVDARNALGYRRISTGNGRGIDGGIWPAPPEAGTFVQLFVEVEARSVGVGEAITEELPRLAEKPMLLAWGGRDWCFNDWYFREWQRHFPQAEPVQGSMTAYIRECHPLRGERG